MLPPASSQAARGQLVHSRYSSPLCEGTDRVRLDPPVAELPVALALAFCHPQHGYLQTLLQISCSTRWIRIEELHCPIPAFAGWALMAALARFMHAFSPAGALVGVCRGRRRDAQHQRSRHDGPHRCGAHSSPAPTLVPQSRDDAHSVASLSAIDLSIPGHEHLPGQHTRLALTHTRQVPRGSPPAVCVCPRL